MVHAVQTAEAISEGVKLIARPQIGLLRLEVTRHVIGHVLTSKRSSRLCSHVAGRLGRHGRDCWFPAATGCKTATRREGDLPVSLQNPIQTWGLMVGRGG